MICAFDINARISTRHEKKIARIMHRMVKAEGHIGKLPDHKRHFRGEPVTWADEVLEYIKRHGPCPMAEIAESLGRERPKVSAIITRLRRRDLIEKKKGKTQRFEWVAK